MHGGSHTRVSRWPPLLTLCCLAWGCLVWTPARAHEADVPSRDALIEELRGMGLVLRRARGLLDADVSLDGHDVLARLNQAQMWILTEDYPKAALRLLQLISRPGFETSRAYPDALAALAEAEWQIGLQAAARRHLYEAVRFPGQAPSSWRERFAQYLRRLPTDTPLATLRPLWARYEGLGPAQPLSDADRAVRYGYGKALFHAKALAEARGLFEAVPADDPYYLRARYFLGVIDVSDGEWIKAQATFEAALAAFEAQSPAPKTSGDLLEDDGALSGRIVRVTPAGELDDGETPVKDVDEATDRQRRVGALIHLSLARLAAAREDWPAAWAHYRKVPRGGPEFTAALSEASFVLARREAFTWCARLIDQLLAGRGDDVSSAQLTLWKYQLLARSERYDQARDGYVDLEAKIRRRLEAFDAAASTKRLFPPQVLAWTAPGSARRVRSLEATLVEQQEALIEAQELLGELDALSRSAELLPVVAFGKTTHARLVAQSQAFAAKLDRAAAVAHAQADSDRHGGGPAATTADVARLRASLTRLGLRLTGFGSRLSLYETSYRGRLKEVLDAERPVLVALGQRLTDETRAAESLAGTLRDAARTNLERYAAEARFGQVDIAYWRKEAVSRQIRAIHDAQADAMAPLDEAERSLPPEPMPSAPKRAAPPADDGPADDAPADDGAADAPVAAR